MSGRIGTDVVEAARALADGGVVAVPTETVYGLAALARDPVAVRRIYAIKGRPSDHPLIVHVADETEAREWASEWPASAASLAGRFWPGPLTIVVPRADFVPDSVTGGRDTVALRVPGHPVALELIRRVGDGLAAPSANRFGRVSPTTAEHVSLDLGTDVDYILEGGPCEVGVESTIVDCSVYPPQVLRPGGVSIEDVMDTVLEVAPATGPSRAPGMMESHYAPRCRVVPIEPGQQAENSGRTRRLDARSDPAGFAREMYGHLRRADEDSIDTLVVELPEPRGIGLAIRDRLSKAAAGR